MFIEKQATKNSTSNRRPVHGVGINDAGYITKSTINGKRVICPFYRKWQGMIARCYSENTQRRQPTYIGCLVCKEWLTFSNFKAWMIKQDWKGKQLDKDIIQTGNKTYSPDLCLFVSSQVNSLLLDRKEFRGDYPKGVTLCKSNGKFLSQCSVNGKAKLIGTFDTPSAANAAYIKFKSKMILSVANEQTEPLKGYLTRISKEYK